MKPRADTEMRQKHKSSHRDLLSKCEALEARCEAHGQELIAAQERINELKLIKNILDHKKWQRRIIEAAIKDHDHGAVPARYCEFCRLIAKRPTKPDHQEKTD